MIESRVDLRERGQRFDMVDIGFIATKNIHTYLQQNIWFHDVRFLLLLCVCFSFHSVFIVVFDLTLCRPGLCGTPCSLQAVRCMACFIKRFTKEDRELSCVAFSVRVLLCVCEK